jgi:uncharacterized delta-60 repeat protein
MSKQRKLAISKNVFWILILVGSVFQNCSGFVVGNPLKFEKTELRFANFNSKVSTVDMCLTNVLLRAVEFTDLSLTQGQGTTSLTIPEQSESGFTVSYFYYEPTENKYYIKGLIENRKLRLDPSGTLIGELELPHAIYDLVSFGFSPCTQEQSPSVAVNNEYGDFADQPYKYFALPYYETRDLHAPADKEFAIQYFTDRMAQVNSESALLTQLEPYRNFNLIGLASTSLLNHTGAFMDRLAMQADHKVVAVGRASDNNHGAVVIARYDANGAIDPTFGNGGFVSSRTEASGEGSSGIAIGPTGAIYVNRKVWLNGQSAIGVLKLLPNGTPDSSFGVGGWVKMNISDEAELTHDLKLLADGSLLLSATTRRVLDNNNRKELLVFKLTPTGSLDTSFANQGFFSYPYMVADYSDRVMLAIRADNKIIVGFTENSSPQCLWTVIRLNPNGTIDTSFAASGTKPGTYAVEVTNYGKAYDMLLQDDNKILFVGRRGTSGMHNFAATRILAEGGTDLNFGTNGLINYDFGGSEIARGVIRRFNSAANKYEILMSGQTLTTLGFGFAILALDDNGQVDTSVGANGTRIFMFKSQNATYDPVAGATMGGPMLLNANNSLAIGGASPSLYHLLTVDN